jgi:hypothetical protein
MKIYNFIKRFFRKKLSEEEIKILAEQIVESYYSRLEKKLKELIRKYEDT